MALPPLSIADRRVIKAVDDCIKVAEATMAEWRDPLMKSAINMVVTNLRIHRLQTETNLHLMGVGLQPLPVDIPRVKKKPAKPTIQKIPEPPDGQ